MARWKTFLPRVYGEGPTAQQETPVVPPVLLNDMEAAIQRLAIFDPGQHRPSIAMHGILCQVARARARDMALRNYFSHTDPEGYGPNYKVRKAGYVLPGHYITQDDGNNIESIGAGYPDADSAWAGWLKSEYHRIHVLGEWDFYKEQTMLGIGYWHDTNSKAHHYWVFLSAPPY